MKRNYSSGQEDNIAFFIGNEVEHTPAFGMRTFIVLIRRVTTITNSGKQ
jgi:hypothetical protein